VQPAAPRDQLVAGPEEEVVRVAEDDLGAGSSQIARRIALTAPCVPTGMKAGVGTTPCGVCISPARASPSRCVTLKRKVVGRTSSRWQPTRTPNS
jgi:hypothetical protein